jgi:short-subunit dehydrogenase
MREAVTVITGASGGIGEAIAHCAAKAGRKLVLVARSAGRMEAVAEQIAASGASRPEIVALDLNERDAADRLGDALAAKNLRAAELVNNAGYGLAGPAETLDRADLVGIVDLNMRALTDLTLRFLPAILQSKGGILNVASTAAFMPGPNMAVYYASKAYVLSFSEALHYELRGRARVTVLCPGPVATGFQARARRSSRPALARFAALSAADVAQTGWSAFERGKRRSVPGLMNKLSVLAVPFVPRALLLAAASRFSR